VDFGANLGGIATNDLDLHLRFATDYTDNTDNSIIKMPAIATIRVIRAIRGRFSSCKFVSFVATKKSDPLYVLRII